MSKENIYKNYQFLWQAWLAVSKYDSLKSLFLNFLMLFKKITLYDSGNKWLKQYAIMCIICVKVLDNGKCMCFEMFDIFMPKFWKTVHCHIVAVIVESLSVVDGLSLSKRPFKKSSWNMITELRCHHLKVPKASSFENCSCRGTARELHSP